MLRHLPNALTMARILAGLCLIPVLFWPAAPNWTAALILFLLAALSDRLDGALARRLDAVSNLGRILDPLADKILVITALLCLAAAGIITGVDLAAVAVIVVRESLITVLRGGSARKHALRVTWLAKWKTGTQMAAVVALLCAPLLPHLPLYTAGLALLWIAAIVTLWTGLDYMRRIRRAPAPKARTVERDRHSS